MSSVCFDYVSADDEFLTRMIGGDESWLEAEAEIEALPAEPEMEAVPEADELEAVPEGEAPPEAETIEAVPEVVEAAVSPAGRRGSGKKKRGCRKQKPSWWETVSNPAYPESEFKDTFHMSRATFDRLCAELRDAMAAQGPVPTQVAVSLMRLAQGHSFRKIGAQFGVGFSTAHKLFAQFCAAVKSVLRGRYVAWPGTPGNELSAAAAKAKFEALTGIPGVTGAVYTTRLPVIANSYNLRHNERNDPYYCVIFQGTVDGNGAFTDFFLGSDGRNGGSKSDEEVLLKSGLEQNTGAPFRLLGGASYPLTDYLLVPYSSSSSSSAGLMTRAQEELNRGVEAGSAVAKDAIMKLEARWAFLQKCTEVKVSDLRLTFETCCVLHNFCVAFGDELDPALAFELQDDEVLPEVPVRSAAAAEERDAIARDLLLRRANN